MVKIISEMFLFGHDVIRSRVENKHLDDLSCSGTH